MAILANDPTKEAQKTETTNVIGPSSGSSTSQSTSQTDSQASQGPTAAQPMSGGGQANYASQATSGGTASPARSRASSGASSGMFQNIKKYAEANKPQAQKMASAVTQDVGQTAKSIGQAVEKQKEQYQAALGQQQSKLQEARDFTSQTVESIMNAGQQQQDRPTTDRASLEPNQLQTGTIKASPPPSEEELAQRQTMGESLESRAEQPQTEAEFSGPSEEDYLKFREYMTGGSGQFGDVSSLNVAKEQQQAKDLQRLAGGAATAEGRRELLKEAFAKRGQYTQGMKGLDDLILSSDTEARKQLAEGVKDIAEKQGTTIEQAQREAMKQLAGYQQGKESFVGDVTKQLTGGTETVMSEAEQAANEMRQQRDELVRELGMTEDQATKFVEDQMSGRARNALVEAYKKIGGQGGIRENPASKQYKYETYVRYKPPGSKFSTQKKVTRYTNDPNVKGAVKNEGYDPNASDYLLGTGKTGGMFGKSYEGDAGRFTTSGRYYSQHFGRPSDVISSKFNEDELALLGLSKEDLGFDIRKQGYLGSKTKDSWDTKAKHWSVYSTGRMQNELNRLRDLVEKRTGRDIMLEGLKREGIESTSALGDYYDQLKRAEDVSTQSAASMQDVQKYNALQDLLYGRGAGTRELSLESEDIGKAAANQAALDKIRQDILARMSNLQKPKEEV